MRMLRGARPVLQPEDALIALVVLVVSALPAEGDVANLIPGRGPSVVGGLIALLAVIGAMVAMATRVPRQTALEVPDSRLWLIGPLIGAIGLTAGDALSRMGVRGGGILTVPALFVAILAAVFADRLPVVAAPIRRLLVMPFVLLSNRVLRPSHQRLYGRRTGTSGSSRSGGGLGRPGDDQLGFGDHGSRGHDVLPDARLRAP